MQQEEPDEEESEEEQQGGGVRGGVGLLLAGFARCCCGRLAFAAPVETLPTLNPTAGITVGSRPFFLWGRSMHQGGREGVSGPLFSAWGRTGPALCYKTCLFKFFLSFFRSSKNAGKA